MTVDLTELRFRNANISSAVLAGVGRCYVDRATTPLDQYRAQSRITEEEYSAGDKLRQLHALAGLDQHVTASLERTSETSSEMSDEQSEAWRGYLALIRKLAPAEHTVVYAVAIDGQHVTTLHTLRAGLARLAA